MSGLSSKLYWRMSLPIQYWSRTQHKVESRNPLGPDFSPQPPEWAWAAAVVVCGNSNILPPSGNIVKPVKSSRGTGETHMDNRFLSTICIILVLNHPLDFWQIIYYPPLLVQERLIPTSHQDKMQSDSCPKLERCFWELHVHLLA